MSGIVERYHRLPNSNEPTYKVIFNGFGEHEWIEERLLTFCVKKP
jgi:hypothetical protein